MAALNQMAAFGLGAGNVVTAAAAAAAAAAVFGVGGGVPGVDLAVARQHAQANQSAHSIHTGQTIINSGTTSSSSCDYHTDRTEWMNRIESSHIDRTLMNRLVMNYLVTEGFKEAADKFGTETGISYPYDVESLNDRIKIRESIEQGLIDRAINFINNMHPDLIDNNRYLAFRLQQQQLIELIREGKLEEALQFAQNHLCEYGETNERIQEELERTMALLAFENPIDSPFADLLHSVQRQKLASEVNSAILEFENLESTAKLNILIKMLLWSQDLIDKKSIAFPKMTDLANARVEDVNTGGATNQ